jgi:hypothetical protein
MVRIQVDLQHFRVDTEAIMGTEHFIISGQTQFGGLLLQSVSKRSIDC